MRGRVVLVVDGDTIHVQIGKRRARVRDIGVNAPEIPHAVRGWQHGGEQASAIKRGLVARHAVRLERDLAHRDSWGRLLAYAWVRRAKKAPFALVFACRLTAALANLACRSAGPPLSAREEVVICAVPSAPGAGGG